MSTYVVFGVSGNTGKVVADALLAKGKSVRVVVRDEKKGEPWLAKGATVAIADLTDAAAIGKALEGAASAYVLSPPNLATPDFRAYQRQVVDAVARGVETSRIGHVVFLSSIGAQLSAGTGPIAGAHDGEVALAKVGSVRAHFLRAAYFMENITQSFSMLDKGLLPSFFPADAAFEMVATRDIGELAAKLLLEGRPAENTIVDLSGPVRSMRDAATVVGKVLKKDITVHEAPVEAVKPILTQAGLTPDLAGLYQEMIGGFATGRITWGPSQRKERGTTDLDTVLGAALSR